MLKFYQTLQNTLHQQETKVFVGDFIEFSSAKDLFAHVVVGRTNVLDNQYGYSWTIYVTRPSGNRENLVFSSNQKINFLEKGYYLIDINLTTSDQDTYPIISKSYNFYAEN